MARFEYEHNFLKHFATPLSQWRMTSCMATKHFQVFPLAIRLWCSLVLRSTWNVTKPWTQNSSRTPKYDLVLIRFLFKDQTLKKPGKSNFSPWFCKSITVNLKSLNTYLLKSSKCMMIKSNWSRGRVCSSRIAFWIHLWCHLVVTNWVYRISMSISKPNSASVVHLEFENYKILHNFNDCQV